jgi:OFA family oxalate/formate antiporter-like MFS transporter
MMPSSVFLVMAAIYTPLLLLAARALRLPEDASAGSIQAPASVALRRPQFYFVWLLFFANISVGILLIALARPMLQDRLQFSAAAAVTVVAILGLFNGLGRLVWSALSDKLGRRPTWMMMAILQSLLFVILARTSSSAGFAVSLWLIGSCYGGGFAICPALVADAFGPAAAGRAYGFALTAWSAAALASPPLGAWLQQVTGSYTSVLLACAGMSVVGVVILAGMELAARRTASRAGAVMGHRSVALYAQAALQAPSAKYIYERAA